MQPVDKIHEFSKIVCAQIRWKRAHPVIMEEIENHIVDQRDAYIANGADEVEATTNAIVQMGDPVDIGNQLDRTHRPKPQWSMIILTAIILSIGLSIKFLVIGNLDRTLFSAAIGLGFMVATYFADFTLIGKYSKSAYFCVLALSAITFIFSPVINGRSFYTGFMPLLFPLAFAAIVYAVRNKSYLGLILCQLALFLLCLFTTFVPTVSGLILTFVSGLIILMVAIHKKWFSVKKVYGYMISFIPSAVLALLALANISNNTWERLQTAINPSIDPMGAGYINTMARAMLDGSKMFGHGTMPEKYSMLTNPLPNAYTNFILTHLIYNFGWIAFIVIVGVLLLFIVKGFLLSFKQKSILGSLVSVSIILTFALQVCGYVTANLGFQFAAPISLPLISYGDTATIINLALIGIMLSVFRSGEIVEDKNIKLVPAGGFITWNKGKLTISFSKDN
jgi:cell division protein FtsW (lipid II flippase)